MIKVENMEAYGFEHAVRGMRNPMNSWSQSDSYMCDDKHCDSCKQNTETRNCSQPDGYHIGKNDLDLAQRLYNSGTEHRTYARMIYAWMDITAPLYWWKEFDRYTVGKSQVSTSTMHKIASKEFTEEDFSIEHLKQGVMITFDHIIDRLNFWREEYLKTKDKDDWWQLIQLLPSSYNQKRTVCMSYEVIFKIIKERTGHKLDEWNDFIEELRKLPYVDFFMGTKLADECPIKEALEGK